MKRDITPEDEAARCSGCATISATTPSSSASPANAATTSTSGRGGRGDRARGAQGAGRGCGPCWSTPTAAIRRPAPSRSAGCCEDHGVRHFEEPCPYWELEQTKQVTDALELDVTGGEQDCDLTVWRRMIDMRAVDVVQPDICYLGGLTRTLRVAKMAEEAGLPCTPHCANLSMVTLFTMHLMGAIPNAGPYVEFSIEGPDYYPWQEGCSAVALRHRGRQGDDPGRAGLGRRDRSRTGWPPPITRSANWTEDENHGFQDLGRGQSAAAFRRALFHLRQADDR